MNNVALHTLTHILPGAPASLFSRVELRKLLRAEFVFTYSCMVRVEVTDPLQPLFDNRSGDAFDASHLSYLLRERVDNRPRAVLFASATKKGRNLLGGKFGGRQTRVTDIDHDYLLAHAYLSLDRRGWESEPGLINGEVPDAIIRRRGKTRLIEAGGSSYSPDHLRARHDAWANHHYLLF